MADLTREMLKKRIEDLEEKVQHLRVSRRVLINLLEKVERERRQEMEKLEKVNRRLQKSNSKYAKDIISKNRRIMELERKLPR